MAKNKHARALGKLGGNARAAKLRAGLPVNKGGPARKPAKCRCGVMCPSTRDAINHCREAR